MRLQTLTLKNFKGIRGFTLDTRGGNISIFGDNAISKKGGSNNEKLMHEDAANTSG